MAHMPAQKPKTIIYDTKWDAWYEDSEDFDGMRWYSQADVDKLMKRKA
jgi:hypothetical protein